MVTLLYFLLVPMVFQRASFALDNFKRCHSMGNSGPVHAFNNFYPPIKSCKSSTLYNGKEVHAINIISMLSPSATILKDSVKISLRKVSNNNASVILVLMADVDLTWDLVLPEHMNWNLTVWLSENTVLKNDNLNSMVFDSQKNLLTWIRTKFGAITSYLEVSGHVNVMELKLEKGHGKQCSLNESKEQKIAYSRRDAVTLSCPFSNESSLVKQTRRRKDVHVIRLHSLPPAGSPTRNPHKKPVVGLYVKNRRSSKAPPGVVIVITSDVKVTFKVRMDPFDGKVDIHTNQEVNNDAVDGQLLAVSAEGFGFATLDELHEWTKFHHGIPRSFSVIYEANLVEVAIDGGPAKSPSSLMSAPPSEDAVSRPSRDLLDLAHDVSVVCHEEFFSVAIVKQESSPSCEWLTLSDETCRAKSNSSHCNLDAKYGQCKECSKRGGGGGGIETDVGCNDGDAFGRYKNEILIHDLSSMANGNASPPYSIKLDCSTASIPGSAYKANNDTYQGGPDVKLSIRLEESTGAIGSERALKYYVEAAVVSEEKMIVTIEDCRLESLTPWKTGYIHHLIRNRCPVGSADWWRFPTEKKPLPPAFSFGLDDAVIADDDIRTVRNEKNFWRVVCRVSPCFVENTTSSSPLIPQCTENDYNKCTSSSRGSSSSASISRRLVMNTSSHPLPSFSVGREDPTGGPGAGVGGRQAEDKTRNEIMKIMMMAEGDSKREGAAIEPRDGCAGSDDLPNGGYVSVEIGMVVSFCAFLIGLLSMSALWFIYAKTRPKKLIGSKHLRSPDTSGESTPSSTSPITICQIKRSK